MNNVTPEQALMVELANLLKKYVPDERTKLIAECIMLAYDMPTTNVILLLESKFSRLLEMVSLELRPEATEFGIYDSDGTLLDHNSDIMTLVPEFLVREVRRWI